MKHLLVVVLCCLVFCTNCEGRKSKSQTLVQNVEAFKVKNAFETISYYPENYQETLTDTILNNGFKTNIKTFTRMDQNLLRSVKKGKVLNKTYYRCIEGEVMIYYKDHQIFNVLISPDFITANIKDQNIDLTHSILKGVWLNQDNSLDDNLISFDIEFCSILSDHCSTFNLLVNSKGGFYLTSNSI